MTKRKTLAERALEHSIRHIGDGGGYFATCERTQARESWLAGYRAAMREVRAWKRRLAKELAVSVKELPR